MTKEIYCVKFNFNCENIKNDFSLEAVTRFAFVKPNSKNETTRGVIVEFKANGIGNDFEMVCRCKVIFKFDNVNDICRDEDFLETYQNDAYDSLKELINTTLKNLGQNKIPFS